MSPFLGPFFPCSLSEMDYVEREGRNSFLCSPFSNQMENSKPPLTFPNWSIVVKVQGAIKVQGVLDPDFASS